MGRRGNIDRLSSDDGGQWILLSGVIIAVSLVALMILLNTAMLTGHSSTESVLSFPKNDLRDLRDQSILEANIIASEINAIHNLDSTTRASYFDANYSRFNSSIRDAYSFKGANVRAGIKKVNVTPYGTDTKIDYVLLNVSYYDGMTRYQENHTLVY